MEVTNPGLLAAGVSSMVTSGNQGGNPVLSKPGLETKAGYMCFADVGGDYMQKPEHDFGDVGDIDKIP